MRIDTRPTGAKIIVNDKALGPAPQTISWNNRTKAPKVLLKRRGFKAHHVTLRQSDDGASRVITLVRLRNARKGDQNGQDGQAKPLNDSDKAQPTWELVPDDR